MPPKVYFLRFNTGNPYTNLALETYLLEYASQRFAKGEQVCFLALWRNENAVVIGKNQDAAAECDLGLMKSENILLARRITGGGAVYHDGGNLNFSYILPKTLYDSSKTIGITVNAVRRLGINAESSGRNDITVCGKKISGSAFTIKGGACLHHGTLLISSPPEKVLRCLTPDKLRSASKGKIPSVGSRVTNLRAFAPEITAEAAECSIKAEFTAGFGIDGYEDFIIDTSGNARIRELSELYRSTDWLFPESKDGVSVTGRFTWGKITLSFILGDGAVADLGITTDSLSLGMWEDIKKAVIGVSFGRDSIASALEVRVRCDNDGNYSALRDIIALIKSDLL